MNYLDCFILENSFFIPSLSSPQETFNHTFYYYICYSVLGTSLGYLPIPLLSQPISKFLKVTFFGLTFCKSGRFKRCLSPLSIVFHGSPGFVTVRFYAQVWSLHSRVSGSMRTLGCITIRFTISDLATVALDTQFPFRPLIHNAPRLQLLLAHSSELVSIPGSLLSPVISSELFPSALRFDLILHKAQSLS